MEIAFDGLQRSTRYPGGLALRFARVVRYRDDKTADEADTIETVRALLLTDSIVRPGPGARESAVGGGTRPFPSVQWSLTHRPNDPGARQP